MSTTATHSRLFAAELQREAAAAARRKSTAIQFGLYGVVGAIAFAVDFGALYALTNFARLHYLVSAAIAFLAGLMVNYKLSLAWVFSERAYSNRTIEFAMFAGIGLAGLGLNEAGMWFLKEKAGMHYLVAKIVTASVVFVWNFGARKAMLFNNGAVVSGPRQRVATYTLALTLPRPIAWSKAVACASFTYFVIAAGTVAYTRLPFVDEGSFMGSSVNIVKTGLTGNPSIPPWGMGIPLPQSTIHNFWVMPGFLYTQAAWFRVFPPSLYSARALSIFLGIAALTLIYLFVRTLSGSTPAAILVLALLSTDFNMIMRVATARMDSMSVALNFGSWLAYLLLRRRSLALTLGVSCALASCGLLVHPNGIFAFAGIAILLLALDRRRIDWRSAAAAAVASVAPITLLVPLYLRAPAVWQAQVSSHTRGRFIAFLHPLNALRMELQMRYLNQFGGGADPFVLSPKLILLLVLAMYFGALIFGILAFRRNNPVYRFALGMFLVTATYFTFFEAGHFFPYNIHLLPWFCILLAGALITLAKAGYSRIATAIGVLVVSVNMAATAAYSLQDRYHKSYLPVLRLVESTIGPHDLLLSHSYFGIPLGFNRVTEDYTLVDVIRRHPKFVTLNDHFRLYGTAKTWPNGPDLSEAGMIQPGEKTAATAYLLSHYALVLKNFDYEVYRRVSE
jgi:putative flippase GtrA